MSQIYFVSHSQREYMFIEIYEEVNLNPEGIICKIAPYFYI